MGWCSWMSATRTTATRLRSAALDTLGKVKDLTVVGNRAYVVNYAGTLHILDVSDPAHPQLLSSYDTPGNSWDVRVAGDRAYVADGVGGLLILNVGNPSAPQKLGTYATWSANDVTVVGNRAYIAGGSHRPANSGYRQPRQARAARRPTHFRQRRRRADCG